MPRDFASILDSSNVTATEIARFDWSQTSLGPIENWPTSLKTTLAMMLSCPAPMFLAWGPDLLCFYNDAYRPMLGYRLVAALGRPFREVWGSIWDDIEPLVSATLAGHAQTVTDMFLDLSREGVPEESWWTFSYSPVFGDDGELDGLLCVTSETTQRVVAERERKNADERLEMALSSGEGVGMWDWDVVNDRVTADPRFASLFGVSIDEVRQGAPVARFFSGIHPDDVDRVRQEIDTAMRERTPFFSEYRLVQEGGAIRWVSAQGRCIYDDAGQCVRFPGVCFDITRRTIAVDALRRAKDERDFLIDLVKRQRATSDAEEIIRMTSEALGKRLKVHRVGFYRRAGENELRHGANWTDGTLPPLTGSSLPTAFGVRTAEIRKQGKTLVFGDSRHEMNGDLLPFAETGVLAGICVPLMMEDHWEAGIFLHHAQVRQWTSEEISFVQEIAESTWVAVERAEALIRLSARVNQQSIALAEASTEIAAEASRRAEAENQLRQLQKMEAVGQLSGGIAHDFNNMLAIIMSGINLARRRLDRGEQDVGKFLDGALAGADRAATLTQRLLAFSRQQTLAPEAVDLNQLISGLAELLMRSLGERVQLETVLGDGLWKAKVDPNELENSIVNLAVNARDAMLDGGRLIIETSNATVDKALAQQARIEPGEYVQIIVTDTGIGMSPEVVARVFEPFFTTKPVGKGTGLGLSQVFGFTRQSGGHIRVHSDVGKGTTFRLYLPRFAGKAISIPRRLLDPASGGRHDEVVLVVEDEASLRLHAVEALRELGYTVLEAASGAEALAIIDAGRSISVLFTDMVMPEMTGRQLVDRARMKTPDLKVIFTTGYTRDQIAEDGILSADTNFLPKPYTLDQLAGKLREILGE